VLLFDRLGGFERQIGRAGQGPGEFRAILAIEEGPGRTTAIWDPGNARLTVLNSLFQVLRSVHVPVQGGSWFGVFEDGRVVMLTGIPDPRTGPANRLWLLGASMDTVRSFMRAPVPARDVRAVADLRRRISVSRQGLVAVSHSNRYVVELWDTAGVLARTFSRDLDWFRLDPSDRADPVDHEPLTRQEAPRVDHLDRLWTVSHVPDEDWRAALGPVTDWFGNEVVGVREGMDDRYLDSMVEVIDPARGVLLGSIRVDPQMVFISDEPYAASYREDEVGHPFVDIWRFTLKEPGGEHLQATCDADCMGILSAAGAWLISEHDDVPPATW
jgi:hypothetical protein